MNEDKDESDNDDMDEEEPGPSQVVPINLSIINCTYYISTPADAKISVSLDLLSLQFVKGHSALPALLMPGHARSCCILHLGKPTFGVSQHIVCDRTLVNGSHLFVSQYMPTA